MTFYLNWFIFKVMKKYLLVMAVLFLVIPSGVRAETNDVVIPDVESRWFGVSWAFERVKHNIDVWVARTDEKKVELELKFAEKEEKLALKIAELAERNPKAAERLGKVALKLEQKRIERMEKLEIRVEKMGEKGENFKERIIEKKERLDERMSGQVIDEDGEYLGVEGEDGQVLEMRGKSVKIKNAKPGVVRMR